MDIVNFDQDTIADLLPEYPDPLTDAHAIIVDAEHTSTTGGAVQACIDRYAANEDAVALARKVVETPALAAVMHPDERQLAWTVLAIARLDRLSADRPKHPFGGTAA